MKVFACVLALMLTNVAWAEKPADVNVVNPSLNVEVANADPVPVTLSPREEAFQYGSVETAFSGSGVSVAIVTVPSDKALVIEHVSASLNLIGANGLSSMSINKLVIENSVGHYEADEVGCAQEGSTTNGLNHFYACSAQTRFYVAPGETLNFSTGAVDSSGGFYRVFVSGHYVPAP